MQAQPLVLIVGGDVHRAIGVRTIAGSTGKMLIDKTNIRSWKFCVQITNTIASRHATNAFCVTGTNPIAENKTAGGFVPGVIAGEKDVAGYAKAKINL